MIKPTRPTAPRWLQALLAAACVLGLGAIGIASFGAWTRAGYDEARCMGLLEQLLSDNGTLGPETRKTAEADFERCKSQGTITAEDVEAFVNRRALSEADA